MEKSARTPKRPSGYGLKSGDHKRNVALQIGLVAVVVLFAVGLIGYIVMSNDKKNSGGAGGSADAHAVRVTSSKLITKDGDNGGKDSGEAKVTMSFYEDFLCPHCGLFERNFGPTISRLINMGAIAADYYMVAIMSRPANDDYSSRAAAAAYCVADESIDAFRRFHTALFTPQIQPAEVGGNYPDNSRLIELARQAGAVGDVPRCINSGKYLKMVDGLAKASDISATPTVRINGENYTASTPQALVAKIREIVGDVPGLDNAVPPQTP